MDLLRTGSDELIFIQTSKVRVTIKGSASHPKFQNIVQTSSDSTVRVVCDDSYEISFKGQDIYAGGMSMGSVLYTTTYNVSPLFYEQQSYEIIIELLDDTGVHSLEFWHDSLNIRNKVTPVGHSQKILSGIINFGNEIGFSDLIIKTDGLVYLCLTLEVFPAKISYKEDYKAIMEDITREIYNLIFDFLKKTYLEYQQNDYASSSPVEFFSIIQKIFKDFLSATDMILTYPHHQLETTREVEPYHKVKQTDLKSIKWIQKHPEQVLRKDGKIATAKALAVKKQVTYDTKENQLTKFILRTTIRRLEQFKKNYSLLSRKEDREVIARIDGMNRELNSRLNRSFLRNVNGSSASAGMSLVFSMAPGYRDLYKYYLMLQRGLCITGDVFNVSIKDLALLYEYWCYIKLNSLMKDRYELISQDIIKVQRNGLFVSLVKGEGSQVAYRNPVTGEKIMLSYNPKSEKVPTVAQRPDNILTLEKEGENIQYKYIFDAKYRINPALPGTYYYSIAAEPGPEVDDINAMHRYRDAMVCSGDGAPYERAMFGAYVLFPYQDEETYRNHRFYKSIEQVNIGGLPLLPSATSLVSDMLDALIADSSESAFERTTLPIGIEKKLGKVNWEQRDVMIGSLREKGRLAIHLRDRFYHVPAKYLQETNFPIHYVAISQSLKQFGSQDAGIRYYGEVVRCWKVRRKDITEIPSDSEEWYYRFEVKEWKRLSRVIVQREQGITKPIFTNKFLLEHSTQVPELSLRSEAEYRLYSELKRAVNSTVINEENAEHGFLFNNNLLIFENGKIHIYRNRKLCGEYSIQEFLRRPNSVFRRIQNEIKE